jgi:hypothetical protein
VPQLGGSSSAPLEEGPIDELKHVKDVKQEPGALPAGFEWSLIDIKNDEQVSYYIQVGRIKANHAVQRGSSAFDGELCGG